MKAGNYWPSRYWRSASLYPGTPPAANKMHCTKEGVRIEERIRVGKSAPRWLEIFIKELKEAVADTLQRD